MCFSAPDKAAFAVSVSMLEIYDEKVHDLLATKNDQAVKSDALQIREMQGTVFVSRLVSGAETDVQVQGLSTLRVDNLLETMTALERGCSLRAKGETAMNERSSRSHAVFSIILEKIVSNDELVARSRG